MSAMIPGTPSQRAHAVYVLRLLLATLMAWMVGGIVATFFDPHWPQGTSQWVNFALVIYIIEFLAIKSYRMADNTRIWKRLGISLIGVNLAFLSIYLLAILFSLWPALAHNEWITRGLRVEVAFAVTWSAYEILRFPGPATSTRPRLTLAMAAAAATLVLVFLWRVGAIATGLSYIGV